MKTFTERGIDMNCLEERIIKDGIVKEGNVLKVDSGKIVDSYTQS